MDGSVMEGLAASRSDSDTLCPSAMLDSVSPPFTVVDPAHYTCMLAQHRRHHGNDPLSQTGVLCLEPFKLAGHNGARFLYPPPPCCRLPGWHATSQPQACILKAVTCPKAPAGMWKSSSRAASTAVSAFDIICWMPVASQTRADAPQPVCTSGELYCGASKEWTSTLS